MSNFLGKDKWHNERIPSSARAEEDHCVASVDSPGKLMVRPLFVSVLYMNHRSLLLMICLICLQCKEQNVRVEESLFPHTYNPNMTLVSCSRYRMDIADCFIYFWEKYL